MLQNCATAEATAAYAARFDNLRGNFRPMLGLSVGSIGIGTYLGESDEATDAAYEEALRAALLGGVNLVDTAVNYRFQRSERAIGKVLGELIGAGSLKREEVVVATKGGYVTFDGDPPPDPRAWFEENYVRKGIVGPGDVVQGSHCMTPRYLEEMIEISRDNLGLDTIDIYYLHNPETQLSLGRKEFLERIRHAFEFLELKVDEGKISYFGTATWNGYRVAAKDPSYLSLAELESVASEIGGPDHHFRAVQLPYNLGMPEALTLNNQTLDDATKASILAATDAAGIAVCASASLLQGQLTRGLPAILGETFPEMESDAQRSLQFVRSTPGINVALAGMSSVEHVRQNLLTAVHPPASFDTLMKLFNRAS
jgi:aryl-alcohol dehydrogenase-like predicted oxidoreductase